MSEIIIVQHGKEIEIINDLRNDGYWVHTVEGGGAIKVLRQDAEEIIKYYLKENIT